MTMSLPVPPSTPTLCCAGSILRSPAEPYHPGNFRLFAKPLSASLQGVGSGTGIVSPLPSTSLLRHRSLTFRDEEPRNSYDPFQIHFAPPLYWTGQLRGGQ